MQTLIFPIAVTVSEAGRITSLSRASIYAAIASGQIKAVKSGRRTLIEYSQLQDFVQNLPKLGE